MKRIFKILLLLFIVSYSNDSFAQAKKHKKLAPKHSTAMANLDWQGTYYGVTPCASCEGIEVTLILKKGNTYDLTTKYLRTTQEAETKSGSFKWLGNKIVLQGIAKGTQPNMYKVEENQIKQLDLKGNQIKGELWGAYILNKTGNAQVEDKRWKLVELNGNAVKGSAETHYVIFHSKDGTLEAKADCNQLNNKYIIKNQTQLQVTAGISTMMACPDNNIEQEFLKTLLNADNLSVNGNNLSLNKGRMAPLARFELVK
jgi:copper homeostasis protein (lipoprotein)